MAVSRIKRLTITAFLWNYDRKDPLFAVNIVAEYHSGRVFQKTYYREEDIPYSFRDFMTEDRKTDEQEIYDPNKPLRKYKTVYQGD